MKNAARRNEPVAEIEPPTEGPWRLEYDSSLCMGGQVVSGPIGPDDVSAAERRANNQFIVRAANAHQPMVEALQQALHLISDPASDYPGSAFGELELRIREALKVAGALPRSARSVRS